RHEALSEPRVTELGLGSFRQAATSGLQAARPTQNSRRPIETLVVRPRGRLGSFGWSAPVGSFGETATGPATEAWRRFHGAGHRNWYSVRSGRTPRGRVLPRSLVQNPRGATGFVSHRGCRVRSRRQPRGGHAPFSTQNSQRATGFVSSRGRRFVRGRA